MCKQLCVTNVYKQLCIINVYNADNACDINVLGSGGAKEEVVEEWLQSVLLGGIRILLVIGLAGPTGTILEATARVKKCTNGVETGVMADWKLGAVFHNLL